jgi:gamma-glutamylaminecyclotransferase
MCLIIIKNQKSKNLTFEQLQSISFENPDGLGILWLDNYKIEKFESEHFELLLSKRPYIAHFRYATSGQINIENSHPFNINEEEVIFQNGTNKNLSSPTFVDTEILAQKLNLIPSEFWASILEITDSRYIVANLKKKKFQIINKGLWKRDKVTKCILSKNLPIAKKINYTKYDNWEYSDYFSNWKKEDNFHEELTYIAVYGTLKNGFFNHYLLSDSIFIGNFETVEKYRMVENGIPYVNSQPCKDGNYIKVEIYQVDKDTLFELDILEGHPNWYERKIIEFISSDGKTFVDAYIYFNDTVKITEHSKLLTSYSKK